MKRLLSSRRQTTASGSESTVQQAAQDDSLPSLEDSDWMEKSEFKRCDSGDLDTCREKSNCDCWHVHVAHLYFLVLCRLEPFGNDIRHSMVQTFLDPDDVYVLERDDFYTAAFADRLNRSIIYAKGGKSRTNKQGVHWYTSESEARNALEKAVSAFRVARSYKSAL
eukprot:scaffold6219_cov146-Cylindrotheca_fusiformis.AAC.10